MTNKLSLRIYAGEPNQHVPLDPVNLAPLLDFVVSHPNVDQAGSITTELRRTHEWELHVDVLINAVAAGFTVKVLELLAERLGEWLAKQAFKFVQPARAEVRTVNGMRIVIDEGVGKDTIKQVLDTALAADKPVEIVIKGK